MSNPDDQDDADDIDSEESLAGTPPNPATWRALPLELFDAAVAHARRALQDLEDNDLTPALQRLRSVPPHKLRRGAGKRQLVAALGVGGPLWLAVRTRIEADPDLTARFATAVATADPAPVSEEPHDGPSEDSTALQRARDQALTQRDEARARLDRARSERDHAVRAHEGARGREEAMRTIVAELEATVADQLVRIEQLARDADDRDEAIAIAVQRERRRAASQRSEIEEDLAMVRRQLDEQRRRTTALGRQLEARANAHDDRDDATRSEPAPTTVVAGRPSRLPDDVRLDTRQGGRQLLVAGRQLLVDGYNVTRTHCDQLPLDRQRQWLVDGLAGLAKRRRLDVTVVFDAHVAGAASSVRQRRGVMVQFSHADTTADDELVFAVAALPEDEPVVVVTDDRELRSRLASHDVDLLHTNVLTWLL